MPFNFQTFKTRTLTAIVFAAVMLIGLLWNIWSFIVLFTIIHFGCWWEFVRLMRRIKPLNYGYFLPFGVLYITMPVLVMIYLRTSGFLIWDGNDFLFKILPCAIIFSLWINDTMAYIVGSLIGRTPFSKISAKKTWEGTIGGAVLCVVVIGLVGWRSKFYSVTDWIIIASLCAFFGTLGDLLESKIKRLAGVKDSGSLLPGHGGFLDRFDSLLVATPFVWLYVYFFMR